jgi:threonine/homoserine/homoserine lactone efflux protein
MTFYGLLAFTAVYALSVALPGPGVAAVVARALARGLPGTRAFIAGMTIGDLVWFTFAATGLAALAQRAHTVFLVVKYLGVLYLLYLAYRMWVTPPADLGSAAVPGGERPTQLFSGGLALTLSNPKTMMFFLALLPTVVQLETLTLAGYLEIAAIIGVLVPLTLGAYALAAARARQFFTSLPARRRLNRSTSAAMAGAAVMIAIRE